MRIKVYSILLLTLVTLIWGSSETMATISTPLTVHPSNPRYFINNGSPVVILGAGQPRATKKGEDYRGYVDDMAAHKVNYGRLWTIRTWDSVNSYFPWARDGGGTAKDGAQKYNLTHWDSNFWSRVKDLCAYAQSKNIYISIILFDECGIEAPNSSSDHRWDYHPFNPSNNVNGLSFPTSGDCVPEFYSLSNSKLKSLQESYVGKMIQETSSYPNVIYEICNEYSGPWDWEKYWVDYVNARCSNMVSVNRLSSLPSEYWTNSGINMVNFHWGTTSASTTNSNMRSYYSKNRAVNYDETPELSNISFGNYRNMTWAAFTGGGNIHLENGVNASASYDAVYYIAKFLQDNGVKFWEMSPNNSLVTSTPGGSAYTLAKTGSEYVTYIAGSGSGSMKISLDTSRTYTAKAYNPSNGSYTNLTVSGGTASGIPSYSSDIVIYIKANGTPVTTTPNVTLSLTVDKSEAVPGDTLTYTVTYRNTGDGGANSVAITVPLPASTTYVSGGSYNSTAKTVNWSISSIAPGATGTVTFKTKVN